MKFSNLYRFLAITRSKRYLKFEGRTSFIYPNVKVYAKGFNLYNKPFVKKLALLSSKRYSRFSRTSVYTPILIPYKPYKYRSI